MGRRLSNRNRRQRLRRRLRVDQDRRHEEHRDPHHRLAGQAAPDSCQPPGPGRCQPGPHDEIVGMPPRRPPLRRARSSRAAPARSSASTAPADAGRGRGRGRCRRGARARRARLRPARSGRTPRAGARRRQARSRPARESPPSQSDAAEMCTQSASSVHFDEPASTASWPDSESPETRRASLRARRRAAAATRAATRDRSRRRRRANPSVIRMKASPKRVPWAIGVRSP